MLTLKTDSLLQVQEGPEIVCRWTLTGFAQGDKAFGVHSKGMQGRRGPLYGSGPKL